MPLAVRALAFCLLAFAVTGCGASNNKSKIEGQWLLVSAGDRPVADRLRAAALVFDGEGRVTLILPGAPKPQTWRYKLLAGDGADFYDLADAPDGAGLFPTAGRTARVTVRIATAPGDKGERRDMTLAGPDGRELKLTLVRG